MANLKPSSTTTGTYDFQCATPVVTPPGYTYQEFVPIDVTITSASPGVSIYYTLDNTEPTTSSTLYTGAITLTGGTILKAKAFRSGWVDSATTTETYIFEDMSISVTATTSSNAKTICYRQSIEGSPNIFRDIVGVGTVWIFRDIFADLIGIQSSCNGGTMASDHYYIERMGYVRFRNVPLAQGQITPYAYLSLYTIKSPDDDDLTIEIAAENVDSGSSPSNATAGYNLLENRTDAVVEYVVEQNLSIAYHNTTNVAPIINEIVSRPGWVSGNHITFIFSTEDFAGTDILTDGYQFYGTDTQQAGLKIYV